MPRELEPYAEFDSENSMDRISVQGKLRAHSQFWLEELEPSSCIVSLLFACRIHFVMRIIGLHLSMQILWRRLLKSWLQFVVH